MLKERPKQAYGHEIHLLVEGAEAYARSFLNEFDQSLCDLIFVLFGQLAAN